MSDTQSESTRPPAIAPGHVAVITGGASGIGLAVAEALIVEGMSVVLADIDAPQLRDVEARLTEDGASVGTMICNTTAEAEVNALIEYAVEQFGGFFQFARDTPVQIVAHLSCALSSELPLPWER